MRSRRTKSNRNREIIAFLTRLKSLANSGSTALADRSGIDENRMRTYISMVISPPSAEPKPGNRRFSPKSSTFTRNGPHMSPALIDRPENGKNLKCTFVEIRYKALRCSPRVIWSNEHKSSKISKKSQYPMYLSHHSEIEFRCIS